ncbi:MAG: ABC transporter permease subunit [Desulfobacterales bacterium]|jgi:ABC-2 type transport system permease protein|nr:ABC transporter permease subunit [Desulfobacterales bacterium]
MRRALHICRRELQTYFLSPIAYIVIAVFLLVTGWFFFSTFFLFNQASLRSFFGLLPIVFAFVVPALTMRLLAEEFHIGSYETLLTLPLGFRDVILGKFLAGVAFIAAMLVPTLAYPITVAQLGTLDWGPVVGGYLGALLLGAAFCAVGLFASSLTRNQIIAFIVGMAICFSLTLIDKMLFFMPRALLPVLNFLAADVHFRNIAKGIIDTRDLIYFASLCFVGLYATHRVLKARQ